MEKMRSGMFRSLPFCWESPPTPSRLNFPSLLAFLLSVGLSRPLLLALFSKDQITIDDWTRRKDHMRNINGNNMGNEDKLSEPLSSRLLGTKVA